MQMVVVAVAGHQDHRAVEEHQVVVEGVVHQLLAVVEGQEAVDRLVFSLVVVSLPLLQVFSFLL